jgi:hypothetical protein
MRKGKYVLMIYAGMIRMSDDITANMIEKIAE